MGAGQVLGWPAAVPSSEMIVDAGAPLVFCCGPPFAHLAALSAFDVLPTALMEDGWSMYSNLRESSVSVTGPYGHQNTRQTKRSKRGRAIEERRRVW